MLVAKYAEIRKQLKVNHDYESLRKLPKDSNHIRLKNRDEIDGRPRAYMRKFKMSRINFRELAHQGKIPGVHKASWQLKRGEYNGKDRFIKCLSSFAKQ